MNGVITQVGNVVVPMISNATERSVHRMYNAKTGGDMAPEATPNKAQLSGFEALIKEDATLAVDFAVWIPHADRMLKKRAIEGVRVGPNGTLIPISLYGPPNPAEWSKSFRLFRSAALGYDQVDNEWLDRYSIRLIDNADKWPARCWPLIYQTEARTRSEHALRVRRRLAMEKEDADRNDRDHPYDPARPWNEVFKQLAVAEDKWWTEELKEPCNYIYTHVEEASARVDGDHPTAPGAGAGVHPRRDAGPVHSPPALVHPRADSSGGGGLKWKKENNKGCELCNGFQTGDCCDMVGSRCAKDKSKAHQCAICLDNRHGAASCPRAGGAKPVKNRGTKRKKP